VSDNYEENMLNDSKKLYSNGDAKIENHELNSGSSKEKNILRDILVKDALRRENEKYNQENKSLSNKSEEIVNLQEVNSKKYQKIFQLLRKINPELKDTLEETGYEKDKNGEGSMIDKAMEYVNPEMDTLEENIANIDEKIKQKEYLEERKLVTDEEYRDFSVKYTTLYALKNKNDELSLQDKINAIHGQNIELSETDKRDRGIISKKFEEAMEKYIKPTLDEKKDIRDYIRQQLNDLEKTMQESQRERNDYKARLKTYEAIVKLCDEHAKREKEICKKTKEKLVLENSLREQEEKETNTALSWNDSEFMRKFIESSYEAYKKIKDTQKPLSWAEEVERDIYNAPLSSFELRDFLDKVRQTHFDRSEEMYHLEMSIQEKQNKLGDVWEFKDDYIYGRLTKLFQHRTRLIRDYLNTNKPDSQTFNRFVTITNQIIDHYDTAILHSNANEEGGP
jgi:hypothetical protein